MSCMFKLRFDVYKVQDVLYLTQGEPIQDLVDMMYVSSAVQASKLDAISFLEDMLGHQELQDQFRLEHLLRILEMPRYYECLKFLIAHLKMLWIHHPGPGVHSDEMKG
jgi:hypothetical protein